MRHIRCTAGFVAFLGANRHDLGEHGHWRESPFRPFFNFQHTIFLDGCWAQVTVSLLAITRWKPAETAVYGTNEDEEPMEILRHSWEQHDPAQQDLDKLLARVTRIRVMLMPPDEYYPCASFAIPARVRPYPGKPTDFKGVPDFEGVVLLDIADADAVRSFRTTLDIVEDPSTFGLCRCLGCPTLELYSGEELLANIGVQHSQAIRWNAWKHSAELAGHEALTQWLISNGMEPDLLDVLNHTRFMSVPGDAAGKCRYQNVR